MRDEAYYLERATNQSRCTDLDKVTQDVGDRSLIYKAGQFLVPFVELLCSQLGIQNDDDRAVLDALVIVVVLDDQRFRPATKKCFLHRSLIFGHYLYNVFVLMKKMDGQIEL